MCTVYIYYVYIYIYIYIYIYKYKTHTCIYFRKIGYVYILNAFVYNRIYINIDRHVNIFKIYTVCVYIYIHIINIHRTHTYYANKNIYLYVINHN